MLITAELLKEAMPYAGGRASLYAPFLEAARVRWVGNDPKHVAMWLAQIAHESGSLRYVEEIASGDAYEGRKDLGNTQPGDGPKFRGHGLLQVTGRKNHERCGLALGLDLVNDPEKLKVPMWAAESAGWFWHDSGCPALMAEEDPVTAVTRRINGGTNGLGDRRVHYGRILPLMQRAAAKEYAVGEGEVENPAAPWPFVDSAASQPAVTEAGGTMDSTPLIAAAGAFGGPIGSLAAAAIDTLINAAPALLRLNGKEKSAQAVEIIGGAAKRATGAPDVVTAAQAVATKPDARAVYQREIESVWFQLTEIGGGIQAARAFAQEAGKDNPVVWQIIKWVTLAALGFLLIANVMVGALSAYLVYLVKIDQAISLLMVVLQADIGAALTAFGFWLGSSWGSKRKEQPVS